MLILRFYNPSSSSLISFLIFPLLCEERHDDFRFGDSYHTLTEHFENDEKLEKMSSTTNKISREGGRDPFTVNPLYTFIYSTWVAKHDPIKRSWRKEQMEPKKKRRTTWRVEYRECFEKRATEFSLIFFQHIPFNETSLMKQETKRASYFLQLHPFFLSIPPFKGCHLSRWKDVRNGNKHEKQSIVTVSLLCTSILTDQKCLLVSPFNQFLVTSREVKLKRKDQVLFLLGALQIKCVAALERPRQYQERYNRKKFSRNLCEKDYKIFHRISHIDIRLPRFSRRSLNPKERHLFSCSLKLQG